MTNVIYVGSLDICRKIAQNVKTWLKKKDEHNAHVCFELNLIEFPIILGGSILDVCLMFLI